MSDLMTSVEQAFAKYEIAREYLRSHGMDDYYEENTGTIREIQDFYEPNGKCWAWLDLCNLKWVDKSRSVEIELGLNVDKKHGMAICLVVKKEPQVVSVADKQAPQFLIADNTALHHTILSVPSYSEAFPDSNYVQIASAQQWGVSPVANRNDAEARKNELVYIGASPFYHIDPMRQSIPYLVPRAAVLLHDIGRCFYDSLQLSLQLKGVPIHQLIVTSVLRTREDVEKLRNYNKNATENSCHLYGTTFDIAYNRYVTVQAPGEQRRTVPSDTLKWVLSEVLNDMRKNDRCYIKYEVKQGCFHITTR